MNLSQSDSCHQLIAYTGFFELHLTKRFMKIAHEGGHFVDIGANYGYYSLLWAAAQKENFVTSIEAVSKNAKMLQVNADLNNLGKRIKVLPVAIGRKEENKFFDLVEETQTTWGGLSNSSKTGFEVKVVPLDSIFSDDSIINLLKIDVEGAETWVIEGASNLLRKGNIKHIFFEENLERQNKLNIEPNSALRLLEKYGYKVLRLNKNNSPVSEHYAFLQK